MKDSNQGLERTRFIQSYYGYSAGFTWAETIFNIFIFILLNKSRHEVNEMDVTEKRRSFSDFLP